MSGFPSRRFLARFLPGFLAFAPCLGAQTPTPTPSPMPTRAPFSLNLLLDASPPADLKLPDVPAPMKGFAPPKVLQRGPVSYPLLARLNRVEGVVGVQFAIDEEGHVTRAIVVRTGGSSLLDSVVLEDAMKQWRFTPAMLNGVPIPSTKDEEFEFRLDPAEEKAVALKRLALPIGTPDAPYPKEAIPAKLRGSATVNVIWTKGGLVDLIYLDKSSGFKVLDHAALVWAYENWHIDPATINDTNKKQTFSKTMTFEPPP